jgi:hypothetical protein
LKVKAVLFIQLRYYLGARIKNIHENFSIGAIHKKIKHLVYGPDAIYNTQHTNAAPSQTQRAAQQPVVTRLARSRSALPSDHYQRASGAYSPDYKIVHL